MVLILKINDIVRPVFLSTWVHPRILVGSCYSIFVCPFVFFLLAIVLLQFTEYGYLFGIFILFSDAGTDIVYEIYLVLTFYSS